MLSKLKNQPALGILLYLLFKRNLEWRMMTDLRAVKKIIQPMGPPQSGNPLPSLLPKGWPLKVIDLKDSFFTIPLQ